jgi:hypothetical protein
MWTALSAEFTHPGLAFARWVTGTLLGGVFPTILANSPNVGALLDRLERFHPLFGKQRLMFANEHHSTSVWLEAADGAPPAHPDTIDAFFAIMCWLTRHLTSNRAAPSRIMASAPPSTGSAHLSRTPRQRPLRAEHDRCTFNANSLNVPIERADPAMLTALEPYADRRLAEQGQAFTATVAPVLASRHGVARA